jgi:hypothetical protein
MGRPVFDHRLFTPEGEFQLITESLWNALRDIRSACSGGDDLALVLWADALCINQGDVSERRQQLKLMGRISRQAQSVVGALVVMPI